jgi:glutamate-1-semialdehyde 2,1-aminomutase
MPERSGPGAAAIIDAGRVYELIARERGAYRDRHPRSRQAFAAAGTNLLGGVPMTWMRMWPGGFPLYLASAHGARLTDIDGNEFVDFCLGDTGAMAGHSPAAVHTANRGVLLTPFHNMALMAPATTEADVDAHTEIFAAAADDLLA